MYCCVDCFDNHFIINEIRDYNEQGDCDYCGMNDTWVAEVGDIGNFIGEGISKGYENATTADLPLEILRPYATDIEELLRYDESIFSTCLEDVDKLEELLNDLFNESGPSIRDIQQGSIDEWERGDATIVLKNVVYRHEDNRFRWNWEEFTYTVKHYNRFFDVETDRSREEMLREFDYFFNHMTMEIPEGTLIWRARLNPNNLCDTISQQTKECGPPPLHCTRALRMNPAGISYFYGAEDKLTCEREIRATDNDSVIFGQFRTNIVLRIVDLSHAPWIRIPSLFSPQYDHDLNWAREFLKSFSAEVSKPIKDEEAPIEYIPTQILCEYIRKKGFHGVRYRSSLTKDYNYTLFCGPKDERNTDELYEPWGPSYQNIPEFTDWLTLNQFESRNA